MDPLETRELTYFVAVAEEQHFGRAARRLGMAQPPLSRAIQQLERRLGVTLFERTTRSVRLTPAGTVLLVEAGRVLDALAVATRRTRQAATGTPRLRVATKPEGDAGLLEKILPIFRSDPAAVPVEIVMCGTGEAAVLLRDGRTDVAFLHTPHDELADFDTEVLLTQPQVAVLPRDHRLADRTAITLVDLADDPLPRWPPVRPSDADGPTVGDPAQLTTLVALGQLIAVVPQSVRRLARTDVAYVRIIDSPHTQVVLARRRGTATPALAAFWRAGTQAAGLPEQRHTA